MDASQTAENIRTMGATGILRSNLICKEESALTLVIMSHGERISDEAEIPTHPLIGARGRG